MRRRKNLVVLTVAVVALVLAAFTGCGGSDTDSTDTTAAASTTTASTFATLPTRKCKTLDALERPAVPLDAETTVPVAEAGLEDFAAFTNTSGTLVIGPKDWKCDSTIYVDGGEKIGLTPDGSDPFKDSAEIGITYEVSSACQGCIAAEICAVMPNAPVVTQYANIGVGCDRKKPLKEELTPIGDLSVLFEDPPGVQGQGDPSGGRVKSVGMLTYSKSRGSQQVTCAVPEDLQGSCPSVISGSMLHSLAYLQQP